MCSYSTVSDWLGARFFLERPPARKFLPTWSLPCVLEALAKAPFEPLAEASLRDVTIKTVFLMAIASGHRRSALRALPAAPGHIRWDGVRLIPNPSYVAKNQTASSKPVKIFLSSLSRHTHRCPTTRSGVLKYLSRTKDRRSGDQFFICTREPFSPRFERCHFEVDCGCYPRSWPLGAVARGYASCTRHQEHQTRPGRCLRGFFRWGDQAAYWQSPNSSSPLYFRDVPAAELSFSCAALLAAAFSR